MNMEIGQPARKTAGATARPTAPERHTQPPSTREPCRPGPQTQETTDPTSRGAAIGNQQGAKNAVLFQVVLA